MTKTTNEGLADLADMAERDHEVQMARSDLYKLAKYAIKLHEMLKNVSEAEGIEGWQQAKITKAADYISSVYHALDYDTQMESVQVKENVKTVKRTLSDSQVKSYKGSLSERLSNVIGK
jgi:predicted RNA-binding protein with EMAP domain